MPRTTAWNVLRYGGTAPLRAVDRFAYDAGLEDRDRALVRRMVGTEVRHRGSLQAIVNHFARGKPSSDIRTHLRLGVVQLLYMDQIPPHAAVSETVRAATNGEGLSRGRYVNGVLREIQRHARHGHVGSPRQDIVGRPWFIDFPIFRDPAEHPFLWAEDALSMPSALVKRWAKRHGESRAFALAELAQDEARVGLRVASGERDAICAELLEVEIEVSLGAAENMLSGSSADIGGITASAAFQEGRITVQGDTAAAAVELLAPQAGERVLELCAAPGGKTAAIAQSGAKLLALDLNAYRLAMAPAGLARIAPDSQVMLAAMDGTQGLAEGALFDAAFVDAPCSNTGVLAQRPGARWRFGPKTLRELCELQARLLEEAAERIRPGGRLVYSTCSIEPEENGQQIKKFLAAHPEWSAGTSHERLPLPDPAQPDCPASVDGGFAALLHRS
ncbi:MAG: 16S rRNA (cytosine967-C5)-methyltransferase [Planctomycetota bacterium]|jgi:16S rRNA (cytosine967-C5)-methyltransferase